MRKRQVGLGLLMIALLVGAGTLLAGRAPVGGDPLRIRDLSRDGMRVPGYRVAVDEASMSELWGGLVQAPERPPVDFSREWVLGAFMGERPTGGYRITIERVSLKGNQITAVVSRHEPGPNDFVTMVFTYPGHVVAVERPSEPGEYTLILRDPQGEPLGRLRVRF